ncbi:hypothetical protein ES319_A06G061100v1 [Gossypium barbadense]|uniref:Uncharacterized protein n=2 Tax=Gossypium barbadense TaxID=3634 RepID=A0A5J5V9Z0_GOSBA|nr:hypothetical protein ES319_A06G061100v1 [Gossypium barbadense]
MCGVEVHFWHRVPILNQHVSPRLSTKSMDRLDVGGDSFIEGRCCWISTGCYKSLSISSMVNSILSTKGRSHMLASNLIWHLRG